MSTNPFLVSPDALVTEMRNGVVKIVDASWYLPPQNRDAKAEFLQAHIPGAVFFDQDSVVDATSPYPHTLPSQDHFAQAAGALGIAQTDTIVVYDGAGLFSAPRVWWLFRTFGAVNVRILDGGFPEWKKAGLATESGEASPEECEFTVHFQPQSVVDLPQMRDLVQERQTQIADARSAERFQGLAPEPRPGVRSGHMPGAHSLPYTSLQENGRLKEPEELREAFAAAGIDPNEPVVTSCGSGVTAAVITLALATLNNPQSRLYDGSWTEWGSQTDTPVETGPGE
ncbi:3-mercaptopyruvate sulfurtransferase [Aureimonas fodinaquatilis]|uniref:3-mercaptopyruvate sulfurtransferase n=1 Tax=Aureimonas fodinaquatilis TaxID=2565783 RepID=A0A5B0DXT8_9HYPH|nr:3-mercaptopyruvate sulfurtransferase [Aureimonas fodinaquatilis]KAA0970561.1 3-mercaptopyruvate sulfurtransferase [Aureimonas fodinaquatilis]